MQCVMLLPLLSENESAQMDKKCRRTDVTELGMLVHLREHDQSSGMQRGGGNREKCYIEEEGLPRVGIYLGYC